MTAKEFAEKNIGKNVSIEYLDHNIGMIIGYTKEDSVIVSFPNRYGWHEKWLSDEYDNVLIKSPLNVGFLYWGVKDLKLI